MITAQLAHTPKNSSFELDVSFTINAGDFVTLYGASGSGKTTILRAIAGLERAISGSITNNDIVWLDSSKRINHSPQRRKMGYVFQDYALFPNMTVLENITFALLKGQSTSIIDELLEIMDLQVIKHQKPATLSGGQKQRVALARTLVQRPKIVLLDEPFSALDQEIRLKLQDYLIELHKKYQLTIILVSHDVSEIFKLSNLVLHIHQGKIIEQGTPSNVFLKSKKEVPNQTGSILTMTVVDDFVTLQILVADTIVTQNVTALEAKLLRIGDQVALFPKGYELRTLNK